MSPVLLPRHLAPNTSCLRYSARCARSLVLQELAQHAQPTHCPAHAPGLETFNLPPIFAPSALSTSLRSLFRLPPPFYRLFSRRRLCPHAAHASAGNPQRLHRTGCLMHPAGHSISPPFPNHALKPRQAIARLFPGFDRRCYMRPLFC